MSSNRLSANTLLARCSYRSRMVCRSRPAASMSATSPPVDVPATNSTLPSQSSSPGSRVSRCSRMAGITPRTPPPSMHKMRVLAMSPPSRVCERRAICSRLALRRAATVVARDRQVESAERQRSGRYLGAMGLNPFRAQAKRGTDVVIVAIALVVVAALVLWAVFGMTARRTHDELEVAARAAVPGGEDLPLPGLRPRDPRRAGPRGRGADGRARGAAPLAHRLLATRRAPAPYAVSSERGFDHVDHGRGAAARPAPTRRRSAAPAPGARVLATASAARACGAAAAS